MNPAYWLLGYAEVRVQRAYAEQVFNLCMRTGVPYLDGGSSSEQLCILVRSAHAKQLSALMQQQNVPYTAQRRGFPQLLRRLMARPGLLLGCLCVLAMLIASECFVFDIRITGNSMLTDREVKRLLAEQGFAVGTFIPGVDTDRLENLVMLSTDQIAWMSVNIRGNVANVELVEQSEPPPAQVLRPAHVIAAHSGEVVAVELYRGNVLVAAGQQVQRGEILIAGLYDSATTGVRFTRASGKVLARTVYSFCVEIPLEYEKKVYTGEKFEKKSLIFFSFPIKVFENTGNCTNVCDIIYIVENCSPIAEADLPLTMYTERHLPYTLQTETRSAEAALILAHRELAEQIAQTLQDGELLQKCVHTQILEDRVVLRAEVTCIADIAAVQEFEIDLKNRK